MTVVIKPLPAAWVGKPRFRPLHPPVFPDGDPTPDDLELALELFEALDAESQSWYGGERFAQRLRDRLPK